MTMKTDLAEAMLTFGHDAALGMVDQPVRAMGGRSGV